MIQNQEVTPEPRHPETGDGNGGSLIASFPWRVGSRSAGLECPRGLVASSDKDVLEKLAKIMGQCNLETFLAFGAGESIRILDRQKICVVLCHDHLIDGNYEDVLKAAERSKAKPPVIVFSSTGDWPEYFQAISAGAFDYMAYPPFLGELPRVIGNALASRKANPFEETAIKISNSLKGEMP